MNSPRDLSASERRPAYRIAETQAVLRAWNTGQSVSIVGVGSAGKSNFVQHLTALGSVPAETWPSGLVPILIDANLLGPLPHVDDPARTQMAFWSGCELMLHRTFMALYPFEGFSGDERTTLYQAYEALQDGSNPLYALLALRYLELGLSVPLRIGMRIVFIFDEFERFASLLPVSFFQSLRGLRDVQKRQITYATVSRGPLPTVIEQSGMQTLDAEPFVELFADNIVYIGAHSLDDAEAMIESLLARRGAKMPASAIVALIACTGGHPGLLRAAVFAALDQFDLLKLKSQALPPALLAVPGVVQECGAIWTSMSDTERDALHARLKGQRGEASAVALLQRKGLLSANYDILPPVFAAYAASSAAR